MAVYTEINDEELEAFLTDYDLAPTWLHLIDYTLILYIKKNLNL